MTDPVLPPPTSLITRLLVKYEGAILNIFPSVVLLILFPATLIYYALVAEPGQRRPHSRAKLTGTNALLSMEMLGLLVQLYNSATGMEEAAAGAALDLLSAGTVMAMALIEYRHHVCTSIILSIYLVVGIFIDATKSVCSFHHQSTLVGTLAAFAGIIRFALLVVETASRRGILFTDDPDETMDTEIERNAQEPAPSIFAFLRPLLFASTGSDFTFPELKNLGSGLSSKLLHAKLKRKMEVIDISQPHGLAIACLRSWNGSIIFCLVLRSVVTGFSVAQTFALFNVMKAAEKGYEVGRSPTWLIGLTASLLAATTLSKAAASHAANSLAIRIRGALTALLFDKHRKLTKAAAKKSNSLTLLRDDVDNIAKGVPQVIRMVFTFLDIFICMYCLSYFIGVSSFALAIPFLAATTYACVIGFKIGATLRLWNSSLEKRIEKTSKMLPRLTAIRMIGLASVVSQLISQLRLDELGYLSELCLLESHFTFAAAISRLVAPGIVIATALFWKTFNGQLQAAVLFPALHLISMSSGPLASLLQDYPAMLAILDSLQRVQTFLSLGERVDRREILNESERDAVFRRCIITNSHLRRPRIQFQDYVATFAIQFDSAGIMPPGAENPLYSDVSFSIEEGSITAVVGRSGSGKSLLLESILGEVQVVNGFVAVSTDVVSFGGQFTWLRDVSVRENIIGPLEYCPKRFKAVINCCLLQDDIKLFPGGDGYIVGIGGINLSGGQCQRIALARAVYADPTVLLLDDAFSSLDRRTASSILFRLCGKDGFLRQSNCTVIFATHLTECIDMADQYLCLDLTNRRITLEQNDGQRGYTKVLYAPSTHVPEAVEAQQQEALHKILRERKNARLHSQITRFSTAPRVWEVLASFICPIGILATVLWVIVILATSAGEFLPVVTGAALLAPFASWLIYVPLSQRLYISLHERLLDTVMRSTIGFLGTTDTDVFVDKFNQSMYQFTRVLPGCLFGVLHSGSLLALHCKVMVEDPKQVCLLLFFLIFFISRPYIQTSRRIRKLYCTDNIPLKNLFQDTADGLVYFRAFGWDKYHLEHAFILIDETQKSFFYTMGVQDWLQSISAFFSDSLVMVITVLCLSRGNTRSLATIGLSLYQASVLHQPIFNLSQALLFSAETWTILSEFLKFIRDAPKEKQIPEVELPAEWPAAGNVVLKKVSARYGPDMPWVLRDISMTVAAGEKVCLFGHTGSGKTSLLLALLGFLEYEGTIEIDGIDIASVPRELLRSRIISISQDQVELEGTIRSNLLPYEELSNVNLSEEERAEAAEDAEEALLEFLSDMGILEEVNAKGGLDVCLQDVEFSKGVLQMLCFTRTVMRYHRSDGKLVILDEATSSMDLDQDKAVQRAMWEFFEGCTILQVAHLEESTEDAELAIELVDGAIAHTQRNQQAPPGVVSRSREMLSPESIIGSADSNRATPVRQMSPEAQVMSPEPEHISLNDHMAQGDDNLFCIGGELLSPDEAIMTLRDRLMSPNREVSPMRDAIPPGAHAVPQSSSAASTYSRDPSQASIIAAASNHDTASAFGASSASGIQSTYYSKSNYTRSTYNGSTSRRRYMFH
ncbi:hypothetical protein PWT90_00368 [Aphanocladium album]|nr:hypothetical protein PWT90_00368 [Aphanocladium album]